jgi:L-alanine-DL-glutamate epimerase-like enolase superfamily enzyme
LKPTDIRIDEVVHGYEDYVYRAPYKFGGRVVDRVTLLNVHCRVTTRSGDTAWGFGSMTMGNVWAFPSATMSYDTTLNAMRVLASRIARLTQDCSESGHPLDIAHVVEPEYLKAAAAVSAELNLNEPIPKLCTLVVASPFDAALHDAFGKVHRRNVFDTYGPDLMTHDVSRYLGPDFLGVRLDRTLLSQPQERIPVFHSVGGLDPLDASDVKAPIGDGLPETLDEWIRRDGLVRLKIKLQGDHLSWDVERTLAIDRIARRLANARSLLDSARGDPEPVEGSGQASTEMGYCLDFNERCPDVEYVLECLRQIRDRSPEAFERILYIEQPTARDLDANRQNVMHEAARLRPIVIDESLTGLESLMLARELGYTGVALKACKGQSHTVLMAAAAQKYKMFLCVQDLTCPGASLIHSVGIAARVPAVAGIEANARQYVPAANEPWQDRFPGIFTIADGHICTGEIGGPGLGISEGMVPR